jgi:hypothetical protein
VQDFVNLVNYFLIARIAHFVADWGIRGLMLVVTKTFLDPNFAGGAECAKWGYVLDRDPILTCVLEV